MVRRLVQNQQVGALDQQPRQAQAGLLAARKHPGRLLPGFGGKAHTVEDFFDLGVHIVGVHRVHHSGAVGDLLGQRGVVGGVRQLCLQGVHAGQGVQRRGKHQLHGGVDVKVGVQPGVLLQIPHGHAGAERRITAVGQAFAAKNAQQRGFAGAVGADHTDAVPFFNGGVDIAQHLVLAKAFA